jgi:hypothetical protein
LILLNYISFLLPANITLCQLAAVERHRKCVSVKKPRLKWISKSAGETGRALKWDDESISSFLITFMPSQTATATFFRHVISQDRFIYRDVSLVKCAQFKNGGLVYMYVSLGKWSFWYGVNESLEKRALSYRLYRRATSISIYFHGGNETTSTRMT